MSSHAATYNIAARMGHWSANHWKTAVFGWLAFVIAAAALGGMVGQKVPSAQATDAGQAQKADKILQQAGFREAAPLTEIVVVQNPDRSVADPQFRSAVQDVVRTLAPFHTLTNLRSPLVPANADQVSRDRHTALVEWDMRGGESTAEKNVGAIENAVATTAKAHPDFFVGEAGAASSTKAFNDLFTTQLGQAGERSIPLTLIVLLLVFGSLVAAAVPLLLALSSVVATTGIVAALSHVFRVDGSVSSVILLVGLAVGVDYTLFYLKREREERAAGRSARAALEAAAQTSGRSVLISGITVAIAMAGMLFTRDSTFVGFAIATMLVVLVAMLGSLTVLPALLAKLGDRVERGRVPYLNRLRRPSGENRVWSKILTPALKRPVLSVVIATAVLVILALPVFSMHTTQSGVDSVPRSTPTAESLHRIQAAFPGTSTPAIVAVRAETDSPQFHKALRELDAATVRTEQMAAPTQVELNAGRTVARISIPLNGDGLDSRSTAALITLRTEVLPDTVGKVPGATYAVTGTTATSYDENQRMKSSAPVVFGFVLVFAFLLLLVSFRSIVVAAQAIVLNLLSVGAAYGVMVAVFQYGWGERALGFHGNGGVTQWLPLFMFVILFGLSMDYHVFILSRVREAYDRGRSTKQAVEHGIKTTAGVVTSAALVMVGVFSIFATLPILDMKELGVGLAAAVLIDATVVRAVLLPATMLLLGDRNWYLPHWLRWLPKASTSETPTIVEDAGERELELVV